MKVCSFLAGDEDISMLAAASVLLSTCVRSSSHLAAILILTILIGCHEAPRFRPPPETLSPESAEKTCKVLKGQNRSPFQIRVLADALLRRGDEAFSFRYVIVSKDPDKLRIDLLPSEGAFTLGMLVSSEGEATVLDTQNKTYQTGADIDSLLASFLGIEGLSRAAIVGLVSRSLPDLDCRSVSVYPDGETTLLLDRSNHSAWYVSTDSVELRKLQVLDSDEERVALECAVVEPMDGGFGSISLQMFEPIRLSGELSITRLETDRPISEGVFRARIPSHYTRVD